MSSMMGTTSSALAELKDFAGGEWSGIDIDALDHVHNNFRYRVGDENELVSPLVGSHTGIPSR